MPPSISPVIGGGGGGYGFPLDPRLQFMRPNSLFLSRKPNLRPFFQNSKALMADEADDCLSSDFRPPESGRNPPPSPFPWPNGYLAGEARLERAWAHWSKLGRPKLIVAPMVDNSELPFRMLCRKYGAQAAYTPMLHSRLFTESEKYRAQEFTTCHVRNLQLSSTN